MIKIHKFEVIGIAISIAAMALGLFLLRLDGGLDAGDILAQNAAQTNNQAAIVTAHNGVDGAPDAIKSALQGNKLTKLVVTDIALGNGDEVEEGDTVEVQYIGTLQNGQEFDNSYKKGSSFTFKVGSKSVIDSWNEGMLGMKEGGQRVLIVPADMAYGREGYGPIPGNATVVYAIELIDVK